MGTIYIESRKKSSFDDAARDYLLSQRFERAGEFLYQKTGDVSKYLRELQKFQSFKDNKQNCGIKIKLIR